MRRLFVLLIVLCISSLASSPTAAASQPATKEDVLQMFQEMRFEQQMKAIQQSIAQQFQGMGSQMMQRPEFRDLPPPERQKKLQEFLAEEMRRSMNVYPVAEIMQDFAPIYAKYLTKADVTGITDFYHSPAGKKLLDVSPQVSQEAMAVIGPKMQERLMKSMEEMQQRARQLFGDSGSQPPADIKN